ncbi:MAG: NUDIX hydrolase [Alphaproteobacteria bacterium]|nr:NUDIX hydrolase [Alphaproteobacteria bacterium]
MDLERMKKVDIIARRLLYDGHYKLRDATFRFEQRGGSMSEELHHLIWNTGTAVAAVVVNVSTGRIVLTRQFRIATQEKSPGWMTEIPAGGTHPGENPEAAIRREILEELGCAVDELRRISTFYVAPGSSSEQMHLFYAEVSDDSRRSSGGGVDAGEDIEVVELLPWKLWNEIEEGRLIDAKTLLAAFWLKDHLRQGQC